MRREKLSVRQGADIVASWGAASSAPTEYWKVGTLAALFRFESSKQLRVVGISGTGYIGLVAELARNSDCAALHAARSVYRKKCSKT